MYRLLILLTIAWIFSAGPVRAQSVEPLKPKVHRLSPSPDLQYRLQALVIQAVPGDVIEFGEGRFELLRQIDIATDNLTLRGQGMEKTILTFKGQKSGGQGIEATGNNFVIERLAIEDTGGILVFDLPGLQQKAGGNVRLYHNRVNANNHPNFAAPGNIVALVPRGTGLMIMATDQVEVFDNDITDHHTANVALLSYYISGKKMGCRATITLPRQPKG